MPIDFDVFLVTFAICGFQEKFSSKITPKNTVSFTRSMVQWLVTRLMSSVCLFCLGLNITNLDFLRFTESLLVLHLSDNLGNSSFRVFGMKSTFLCEKKILVSSAKRMRCKIFDTLHMSLM